MFWTLKCSISPNLKMYISPFPKKCGILEIDLYSSYRKHIQMVSTLLSWLHRPSKNCFFIPKTLFFTTKNFWSWKIGFGGKKGSTFLVIFEVFGGGHKKKFSILVKLNFKKEKKSEHGEIKIFTGNWFLLCLFASLRNDCCSYMRWYLYFLCHHIYIFIDHFFQLFLGYIIWRISASSSLVSKLVECFCFTSFDVIF